MGFSIRILVLAALVSHSCYLANALVALPQAPEPTSPPQIGGLAHIYERAESPTTETLTVAVAPNNTCGYYTPQTGTYVSCNTGHSCLYETDKYNVAFCANNGIRTSCMNSADAENTDKCDEYCRRNTNIEKCTYTGFPECYTVYYPNDMKGYLCKSTTGYRNAFLPFEFDDLAETSLEVAIYPAAVTASSTETSDETTTRPTATATSESQDEGDGGSKNNTGAIVGGVVGGVVGLAGLGLAMFLIRRRSNKKKQAPLAEMADQSSPQPQMAYGMTPEQQHRWSTTSQPPAAWKPNESPPGQALVEAPDGTAAQVHELDGGRRGGQ